MSTKQQDDNGFSSIGQVVVRAGAVDTRACKSAPIGRRATTQAGSGVRRRDILPVADELSMERLNSSAPMGRVVRAMPSRRDD